MKWEFKRANVAAGARHAAPPQTIKKGALSRAFSK
jgi:hypothetical protein